MKYDDASWHYGGDFPENLPSGAGATHIGMFVAWAVTSGLAGAIHTEDFPDLLQNLIDRSVMPAAWFISACDEKFTDEDLSAEGNAFATVYYLDSEPRDGSAPDYLADYADVFHEYEDTYRVPDDWASFDRLKPTLDQRLAEWRS